MMRTSSSILLIAVTWIFLAPCPHSLAGGLDAVAASRTALAREILSDQQLRDVQQMARMLLKTGLNAGSTYGQVWIRDLNTFIEVALEVNEPQSLRDSLLTFFKFQGTNGDIVDGYIPRERAKERYGYRSSPLAPDLVAHKNTVETDQESSLVQAIAKYVRVTRDRSILDEQIGGARVRSRLASALQFVRKERFDTKHGLVWSATTADWGDVQPEHGWGVEMDTNSHCAIDIYDNAMLLIAIDDYLQLVGTTATEVSQWRTFRDGLRRNIRKHLWDETNQKFIPHLYLEGSPFPKSFDETAVYYHGGTAVAIEASLLNRAEISRSLEQMKQNVRDAGAGSIGLTLYPTYPEGSFKNPSMKPYGYQNGGDWCWFGGRTIQQLIRHGFVEEAYRELKPMVSRVKLHGDFREWWSRDNQPRGSKQFRGSAGVLGQAIAMLLAWAEENKGPGEARTTLAPSSIAALPAAGAPPPRPNIIFFLSDDHAAQAIGCYGGKLMPTPNLDRIAAGGMRFDRCFCTESICGPSRAAILTGKYGHITGAMGWKPYDRQHRTFPEYLRESGYQTALVGKYHLGNNPPGFDYFDILPGQGRYHDPEFISAQGKRVERGHVSDVVASLALAWLERRDTNRPFAICINDKATHMPWQPAKRFESLFANETIPEPPTLHDDRAGRASVATLSWLRVEELLRWQKADWGEPPTGLTPKQRRSWLYQEYLKHYLRCAAGIDENVGRVLDWLDRNQLAQDTVVIYASDQGFFLGEHGWFDKRWMMEESLRMPLLVRYPRLIKPGSVCDSMVLNVDFAPMLLDLAGVPMPDDLQGRSLRPLLTGRRPADWRRSIYYRYYAEEYGLAPHYGVRTERYKLIHYHGQVAADNGTPLGDPKQSRPVDEWELLDLQNDPDETLNLYARPDAHPVVKELKRELDRLRTVLRDQGN